VPEARGISARHYIVRAEGSILGDLDGRQSGAWPEIRLNEAALRQTLRVLLWVVSRPARLGTWAAIRSLDRALSITDLSLLKNTKITEAVNLQFRAEAFDIFNHPNFGNPNLNVGSSSFGSITSTRFPNGDFGSARQLQLALKLQF
jgi:hypothetical protein